MSLEMNISLTITTLVGGIENSQVLRLKPRCILNLSINNLTVLFSHDMVCYVLDLFFCVPQVLKSNADNWVGQHHETASRELLINNM